MRNEPGGESMKTYRMKAISLLAAWILAMSGCLTPVSAESFKEEQNNPAAVENSEAEPVNAQAPAIEWFSGGGAFQIGDKALLEIKASVGDGGTLTYQWYRSADGNPEKGTAVEGASDTMFEAPNREAGIWYYYWVVTKTNEQADG